MGQTVVSQLAGWVNFYVIVGSSAGALTGLQFVVMTLIAQAQIKADVRAVSAFGTPTVVQFCATLLIAAIMSAPWTALINVGICLAICGVAGILYSLTIIRHAIKADYTPVAEDWIWYVTLPIVGYAALATSGLLLSRVPGWPLFAIAATALLLLFVGIHNAWDTVTYVTIQHWQNSNKGEIKNVD